MIRCVVLVFFLSFVFNLYTIPLIAKDIAVSNAEEKSLELSDRFEKNSLQDTKKEENKEEMLPAIVLIETTLGNIVLSLYEKKSPDTCKNFLKYVKDGFYDGMIFHRVVSGFLIQTGGFTKDFEVKATYPPVSNESYGGISNTRGSVAMALTTDPNSATSQFFINVEDNPKLDFLPVRRFGYTVFAKVVEGMDVVDKIQRLKTRRVTIYSRLYRKEVPLYDVPEETVLIKKVIILRGGN